MLMLYFSGTGNSKYIAKLFSEKTGAKYHSIEENIDFVKVIEEHETIAFCYPIYGSCVPRIMREFVSNNLENLKNKKLIILCTQLMFSGDGARAFTDLLPNNHSEIIYAEHFNMPNNICNFSLFKIKNGEKTRKYLKAANKKMDRLIKHINEGVIKKRGFNAFSKFIGKSQSAFWPDIEIKNKSSVQIDSDCTKCGACIKLCPSKNLEMKDNKISQNDNCIICYRCVNACPKKAITVLIHKKPKMQYKGVQYKGIKYKVIK
ncbi:MAG: EFR1 family ferrodoxin [Peptostreptococcaceae bacterium]